MHPKLIFNQNFKKRYETSVSVTIPLKLHYEMWIVVKSKVKQLSKEIQIYIKNIQTK